jgi:hypothetical protein
MLRLGRKRLRRLLSVGRAELAEITRDALFQLYSNEEDGKELRRYWTTACSNCPLKPPCTAGSERRITRWKYGYVLEAVQQQLDANRNAMRQRRETVEHPFGTIKARMGATHFLMKTLPRLPPKWRCTFWPTI